MTIDAATADRPNAGTNAAPALRARLVDAFRSILDGVPEVAVVGAPLHGNAGDALIWLGQLNLLAELGIPVRMMRYQSAFGRDSVAGLARDAVVLDSGGGNFGDLWPFVQGHRQRIYREVSDRRIVLFPQSMHFRKAANLRQMRSALEVHPDVVLTWRDEASYQTALEQFPSTESMLVPDVAFAAQPPLVASVPRLPVLCLARDDSEGGGLRDVAGDDGVCTDWNAQSPMHAFVRYLLWFVAGLDVRGNGFLHERLRRTVMNEAATLTVAGAIRQVSEARVVVSDRLHAHVLCTMLGVPHVMVDDGYGKIRSFMRTWRTEGSISELADSPGEAVSRARERLVELEATPRRTGVLFVLDGDVRRQPGPLATWVSAAGWATACEARFGAAWTVTWGGVRSTPDVTAEATKRPPRPAQPRRPRPRLPMPLRALPSDVRTIFRNRRLRKSVMVGPWMEHDLAFVWQRHHLFQSGALALGRVTGAPSVVFVDGPVVWESRQWGVSRPLWGALLERYGEARQLRSADIVACVSEEVADGVVRLGVHPRRVVVTPCAADLDRFRPHVGRDQVRDRLGLTDRFVVGWTGSFRTFHALDLLVKAAAMIQDEVPALALMLVGDGSQREGIEAMARRYGLREPVLTGTVPHEAVASHLNAMDVCVLPARADGFHYSPLKLHEYLACGRPVVASRVGEVGRLLTDGKDAIVVTAGDAAAIAEGIRRIHRDADLAQRLSVGARQRALQEGSWPERIDRVLDRLGQVPAGSL